MTDTFKALPNPVLDSTRTATLRANLLERIADTAEPMRRRWFRLHPRWAAGIVGAGVLGSAGTAYAAIALSGTAAPSNSIFCYSEVSTDIGPDAPGTGVTVGSPISIGQGQQDPVYITQAVATCASLWQQGVLKLGVAHYAAPATLPSGQPVPHLTACVRSDNTVGVVPGPTGVCPSVNMAAFTGYSAPSTAPTSR